MSNRLNLNFHLRTSEERLEYVNAYLDKNLSEDSEYKKYDQEKKPFPFPYEPTAAELETIANYILYGKSNSDSKWNLKDNKGIDGKKSIVDAGYVEIKSKNSAWNRKEEESLDSMFSTAAETGVPIETQFGLVGDGKGKRKKKVNYKVPKPSFSREECIEALSGKDEFLLGCYRDLWKQIDITEYIITSFELRIGKRKTPIRDELEERLSANEKVLCKRKAMKINIYSWSKMRKMLVELRREQYILKDSYAPTLGRTLQGGSAAFSVDNEDSFLQVLPFGLKGQGKVLDMVFMNKIQKSLFKDDVQDAIRGYIKEYEDKAEQGVFDFRNLDHVTLLIYAKNEMMNNVAEDVERLEYIKELIETLDYYIAHSRLEDIHKEIIEMKSAGSTNEEIRTYVNTKYGKGYSANYISTIFRAKCCQAINDAAVEHTKKIEGILLGEDSFKRCNTCHELLLKDANNFVRKARAKDGLAGRCKSCDKKARMQRGD